MSDYQSENEIELQFLDTKDKPFLIVNKPSGLPSAPLYSSDTKNALMMAAERFPEILKVKGKKEIEYGLLHRLDSVTSGLLLIATTQDFYDYMIEQQKEGNFAKYYTADCQIKEDNWKFLEGMGEPEFYLESCKNQSSNKQDFFPPQVGTVIKLSSYFRHFGKNNAETRPVTEKSSPAALKKIGKKEVYTTEVRIISVDLK
ncbi:MAG: RNA pseudouridine synthase, partial [Treponema sp.]|nr:RNA pseudouridine synthase [Treponema sp.]